MKYYSKIFNKIKRQPILEKIVVVFMLLLILCLVYNLDRYKEGYTENKEIIKKVGNKVYDGYYADIYDAITFNFLSQLPTKTV